MTQGALEGVRVLDLSRVLAGPWATQLLADYGAEVIKVERPGTGDDTRHWGPPWLDQAQGVDSGADQAAEDGQPDSAYFQSTNRNKRSITINLAHKDGQRLLRDLAMDCDVLVENYKNGDLDRYGLDSKRLCDLNPALIYCTISAFDRHGSRADNPGYDAMMQASAGLMSITGEPAAAGGAPQKVGVAISDIMAGMYAASAILAALLARQSSGKGQVIEVPLYESQVAWLANQGMNYLFSGNVPQRLGSAHPNIVPYQIFEAADGFLMLAVGTDRQFEDCVSCLGMADLASDRRFSTNSSRVSNRDLLIPLLAEKIKARPIAYWLTAFDDSKVPAGPVNDLESVLTDDYAIEQKLVRQLPHKVAGQVPTIANPVRFSEFPIAYRHGSPILGEHTQEVLESLLGLDREAIESLRADGAI